MKNMLLGNGTLENFLNTLLGMKKDFQQEA